MVSEKSVHVSRVGERSGGAEPVRPRLAAARKSPEDSAAGSLRVAEAVAGRERAGAALVGREVAVVTMDIGRRPEAGEVVGREPDLLSVGEFGREPTLLSVGEFERKRGMPQPRGTAYAARTSVKTSASFFCLRRSACHEYRTVDRLSIDLLSPLRIAPACACCALTNTEGCAVGPAISVLLSRPPHARKLTEEKKKTADEKNDDAGYLAPIPSLPRVFALVDCTLEASQARLRVEDVRQFGVGAQPPQ